MKRRGYGQSTTWPKATDAATGAGLVRKFMIDLYDREDGRAVDWPLIADALFRAAFDTLDEAPDDPRRAHLLRRVHEGAYNRLVQNEDADGGPSSPPRNTHRSDVGPGKRPSTALKP